MSEGREKEALLLVVTRIGFWGLLGLIPLLVWPRLVSMQSPYLLVKWTVLGVGGGVLLGLSALILWNSSTCNLAKRWLASPASWGMIGLGGIMTISAFLSPFSDVSQRQLWQTLVPLAIGCICGWIHTNSRHFHISIMIMIGVGGIVGCVGILDTLGVTPFSAWLLGDDLDRLRQEFGSDFGMRIAGELGRVRMGSTLGNPAYVGSFLIVPTTLLAVWLLERLRPRKSQNKCLTALGWTVLLGFGVALVTASTREAFLGIGAGLLAWLSLHCRGLYLDKIRQVEKLDGSGVRRSRQVFLLGRKRLFLGVAGIFWGGILLVIIFSTSNPLNVTHSDVAGRFGQLADLRSESIHDRIVFTTLAGRMVSERPWLGWGPGAYGLRFYPTLEELLDEGLPGPWARVIQKMNGRVAENAHNDIAQIAVESGVLGLGAFLWIVVSILVMGFPLAFGRANPLFLERCNSSEVVSREEKILLFRPVLCAWIATLVPLATSFPLHTPARALYFWVLTGLALGLSEQID